MEGEVMITRYQMTVWIDVPDTAEGYDPETYSSRDMEHILTRVLRRLEFDSDLECVGSERIEE
jgi:hypothetical protein